MPRLAAAAGRNAVMGDVQRAMKRLQAAERERYEAIGDLVRLGVVRSHVLVGDLGEQMAANYYGVELQPQFTRGFDLIDPEGRRISVKTLLGTPGRPRTVIGPISDPCDVVFVLRLDFDFAPQEALEIPVGVAREHITPEGKLNWTRRLVEDPRVVHIGAAELGAP